MDTAKQTATKPGFTEAGIMTQPPDYVLRDKINEDADTIENDEIIDSEQQENSEGIQEGDKKWAQRKTNETLM